MSGTLQHPLVTPSPKCNPRTPEQVGRTQVPCRASGRSQNLGHDLAPGTNFNRYGLAGRQRSRQGAGTEGCNAFQRDRLDYNTGWRT